MEGPLSCEEADLVEKLASTNCKGYAQARLLRLDGAVLKQLLLRVDPSAGAALSPDATAVDIVGLVLEAKKMLEKKRKAELSATQETAAGGAGDDGTLCNLEAPSVEGDSRGVRTVFKRRHEIHITAFNSLKLRLDREELNEQWDQAILEFSRHDVLMVSEVRASDKWFDARAENLLRMLNDCDDAEWTMVASEPSGPGAMEVHLILCKKPIEVVAHETLRDIDGLSLDHAPIVATLQDNRFVGEMRKINVVSVHMPPKSSSERRAARDAQIQRLTRSYSTEASSRLNQPFSTQAAKESRKKQPFVAHVIGGDFNANATELRELGVEADGFEVQLGNIRTSAGGKAYDNFLVSKETKNFMTTGVDVLDLAQYANFSRGSQGISDHAPIVLRLTETSNAARPK